MFLRLASLNATILRRKVVRAAFLYVIALLLLRPQYALFEPSQRLVSQEPRDAISIDVELVNVTVTAIDESGISVQGLTAEDFQVFEDGRQQKISFFSHDGRVPVSIGVLIDISGSLQDKLRQSLQTVRAIARSLSNEDEMFVVTFNSHAEVRQKFTNNPEEIQRSLGDIRAKGETAVYDAISLGLREMQTAKHQRQILLLVSDGFDTRSKINADQAEDLLKRCHVLLYAIGIDDDDNDPAIRRRARYHIYDYMLSKLTSAGGGRLIRLYTGRNYDLLTLSELFVGEFHQQYTIGYYPSAAPDNANWRSVEVRVTKPGIRLVGQKNKLYKRSG
jgi:Ca-activated chloride channel family protein